MINAFLLSSSKKAPYYQIKCATCEDKSVVSPKDKYCPRCATEFPKKGKLVKSNIVASLEEIEPNLICKECDSGLITNSEENLEELSSNLFCPKCASDNLVVTEDTSVTNDTPQENEISTESETLMDEEIPEIVEDEEEAPEMVEEDEEPIIEEDTNEEVEDEVKDKLMSCDNLEAALISNPEDSWVFFNQGKPAFKIVKSKISEESHPIFKSDDFVNIFNDRVNEVSLDKAIDEFNGEILDQNEVISSFDLRKIAYEELQANTIPKLIDCLVLATEGAAKGIYPELNEELKKTFFDELVTRGMDSQNANEAIEASFSSSLDLFSSLIHKSVELLNKSNEAFDEVKATIQKAGSVKSAVKYTGEDLEHKEFRNKLEKGNVPILASTELLSTVHTKSSTASLKNMRNRLSLRQR